MSYRTAIANCDYRLIKAEEQISLLEKRREIISRSKANVYKCMRLYRKATIELNKAVAYKQEIEIQREIIHRRYILL